MAATSCSTVFEDEDWLQGYLSTTKYSNNTRINSKPVKQVKTAAPAPSRRLYSLGGHSSKASPRRKSWASERSSSVHPVESNKLPERVNAVRVNGEAYRKPQDGHFIREHSRGPFGEQDMSAFQAMAARRQSLDYDDIEAVKERLQQATSIWKNGSKKSSSGRKAPSQSSSLSRYPTQ